MKIAKALWQINMEYQDISGVPFSDRSKAVNTAIKSLEEWNELLEECGRVAIRNREDLFKLVEKHIERIEKVTE